MLIIHGVPFSVHVRKAVVAAKLKGLDYRVEPVIPFKPPANWAELSPTGLIPVLEDDGFLLSDSTAICLYLERCWPNAGILPAEPRQYGRALAFDAYAGLVFRQLVHGLFVQKVIGPNILGQPTDQAVIDGLLANVEPKLFRYLDSQAGGTFLVGESLSLADIAVASNLINYQYLGLRIDETAYPRLAAFLRRMIAEPAIRAALEAEAPFTDQMGLDRTFIAG
jgi:glutathione S-transferase